MMGEVVSLSKARKAKARADKEAGAEANRLKFGQTKAAKKKQTAEELAREKALDAARRDTRDDD